MKFVIAGHIDHGKSTLLARLLMDTKSLSARQIARLESASTTEGRPFELGYLMDQLSEEQAEARTIESSQAFCRTENRLYTLIDVPGHEEFLRNALMGASQADAAILVVDAKAGVEEQTRRHISLLQILAIPEILVVINKMDLVGYAEAAFLKLSECIKKTLGPQPASPVYIPVSAHSADNVVNSSPRMPWYRGPTLTEAMDSLAPRPLNNCPLRAAVQGTTEAEGRTLATARIESGELFSGEQLLAAPRGDSISIHSLRRWNEPPLKFAGPGATIAIEASRPLSRGEVLCREAALPIKNLTAIVLWLNPLRKGPLSLVCGVQSSPCRVKEETPASTISDCENVLFELERPLVIDLPEISPPMSRFVIAGESGIVGVGLRLT